MLSFSCAIFDLPSTEALLMFSWCFGTSRLASDTHRRPDWGGSSLGLSPNGILSCPHVTPFQPDPPWRAPPPPHGPYSRDELQTKSPAFLPNSLRGLHQRSSPPILQTSSAACTPMRLKRIRCSALTGVMTVDACCNFQPPLQVDTHRTACTVAVFFTSNDVPALGLASQLSGFSSHHQGEGLEDLTVSPVPLSAACTHSTLMPLSFSWNTCATTLTHIRCYIHLKME